MRTLRADNYDVLAGYGRRRHPAQAASFYVAAATYAGIELSPHIHRPKA